jgi:hypothetical protein
MLTNSKKKEEERANKCHHSSKERVTVSFCLSIHKNKNEKIGSLLY